MDQNSLVNNIAEVVGYPAEPVARDLEDRDACTRLTEVIHLYIYLYYLTYRFLIYNTRYIQELLF